MRHAMRCLNSLALLVALACSALAWPVGDRGVHRGSPIGGDEVERDRTIPLPFSHRLRMQRGAAQNEDF
ncbi:hypothetical protein AURDEDRAFT_161317 [Auricularia subglabra TFB-10046 SS5]|nr:hypothetical protein AURDEDRAFT_161317 [Auricularia subglabra TFB-10046 SS5]